MDIPRIMVCYSFAKMNFDFFFFSRELIVICREVVRQEGKFYWFVKKGKGLLWK